MLTVEILEMARELIKDPKNWTQGAFARNPAGSVIGPRTLTACQWCLAGAIVKSAPHDQIMTLSECYEVFGDPFLPAFNDTHTHAEVLQLLEKGIGYLRNRQSNQDHSERRGSEA